jgi:hypothetical protein
MSTTNLVVLPSAMPKLLTILRLLLATATQTFGPPLGLPSAFAAINRIQAYVSHGRLTNRNFTVWPSHRVARSNT